MCGISGIFAKEPIGAAPLLNSMKAIKHRGPDDSLILATIDNSAGFLSADFSSAGTKTRYPFTGTVQSCHWLGFNRLAISKSSDEAMQPFYDEASQTSFVLNGEIYNYAELSSQYLSGVNFNSGSGAELAFQLYLKLGERFVDHIRGTFVIVITDYKQGVLKVWRDRFGIKPLYYFNSTNAFIFSSEIGGLFATGLVNKEIDPERLARQLYLGSSQSPDTIYKNIASLEPASVLTYNFSMPAVIVKRYWALCWEPQDHSINTEEFQNDIAALAHNSLEGVAPVPKSIMLSGGLDSGMLAYYLAKKDPSVEAVTLFLPGDDYFDERNYTRINADHAGIHLKEIEIPGKQNFDRLQALALAEEEPNTAPEATYFLSLALKGQKKILYNALGLDELFYGYGHYVKAKQLQKLQAFLKLGARHLLPQKTQDKLSELGRFGIAYLSFISRSILSWKEICFLFSENSINEWEHPLEIIKSGIANAQKDFVQFPLMKQLSFIDFFYYVSSHHSLRSDRPSMLNAIEMRFPYLDHLFIQKYFNQQYLEKGLSLKYPKPFLRSHSGFAIAPEVLKMPKRGFGMPVFWADSINGNTIAERLKPLLNKEQLLRLMNSNSKKWLFFSLSEIYNN